MFRVPEFEEEICEKLVLMAEYMEKSGIHNQSVNTAFLCSCYGVTRMIAPEFGGRFSTS